MAFRLNEDRELANLLMELRYKDIRINAKKRQQQVEILGRPKDLRQLTRESLEVYERIAKIVREVAHETTMMPGVSRGERLVVRGSISRRVIYATLGGATFGLLVGIIWVAVNAANKDLSTVDFAIAGICIAACALLPALWQYLSLGIKRLRGRF